MYLFYLQKIWCGIIHIFWMNHLFKYVVKNNELNNIFQVCLKGTTLLFYPCESKEGQSVEATPRHLIIVDGSIMQAIPEHPKRDFIFCLSTAFGDAYLFQVHFILERIFLDLNGSIKKWFPLQKIS